MQQRRKMYCSLGFQHSHRYVHELGVLNVVESWVTRLQVITQDITSQPFLPTFLFPNAGAGISTERHCGDGKA